MRLLEKGCADCGINTDTLMENAGLAVAKLARKVLGTVAGSRVLVLVGPGNNGGDGLVVARYLQGWGALTTAFLLQRKLSDDPKLRLALESGVSIILDSDDSELNALDSELARCRLSIDAVFGTGRVRPLDGMVREVLLRLDASRNTSAQMRVIAVDLPSGLDANTGLVDPACPKADVTVALGLPKVGHLRFPGADRIGLLEVVDIGIPDHLTEEVRLELMAGDVVRNCLPIRKLDANKGTFGHALVIGGSRRFVGAPYLASQAAARVGAGLVTVAAPKGIYPVLAPKLTEVIHFPLLEDADGNVHSEASGVIKEELSRYDSLLIGCGLGQSTGTQAFVRELLFSLPFPLLPVLVDADGLNNLSRIENWWHDLNGPLVLTPHPGEMSTLTGVAIPEIQSNRVEVAMEWASRWRATVVLKGAHTVVASNDGQCHVSPFANAGLASGGTGDVLSGIIVGLLAQGIASLDAAKLGVFIHGLVGETVRAELGDAGMLASDLLPKIPVALRQLNAT